MKMKKQWWIIIGIIFINILFIGFSPVIAVEPPSAILPLEELPAETQEITALREKVEALIDEYTPQMIEISDYLYHHPESGYFEFESAKYVTAELEKNGFEIEWGVKGLDEGYNAVIEKLFNNRDLPQVFTAKYKGKSEYPVLAFTTEMDALRGDPPFHGCMHNQQPAVALGAAIAMTKIMDENNLPGSIWVIFLPAEEIPPPDPTAMFKAGYFDEVDFALQTHGGVQSGVFKRLEAGVSGGLINANLYEFYGKEAHSGGAPWDGRDAGDALRAMWMMIDMLREHSEPGFRFHGAILETAQAPNVINPYVSFDHWVRASSGLTQEDLDRKVEQINTIAKAAAMGTFCEVEINHYADYGYGCTTALSEALGWYYSKMYSDEGMTSEEIGGIAPGWDVGQIVSWSIPGIGSERGTRTIAMADVPPAAGHSQELADLTLTPLGHRSLNLQAKRQAAVALRLITQPQLLEDIKAELAQWREYGVAKGYVSEDMFRIKNK